MRKYLLFVLLSLFPVSASALGLDLGKTYVLAVSTSMDLDTVGAYDLAGKEWLTGFSKDLLVLWKGDQKRAYLAGEQLFSANEAFKGSFGLAAGVMTGTLCDWGFRATQTLLPEASMPSWVRTVGKYVSVEVGGGYRLFGMSDSRKPWVATVGGKVRIPIDDLKKLIWK